MGKHRSVSLLVAPSRCWSICLCLGALVLPQEMSLELGSTLLFRYRRLSFRTSPLQHQRAPRYNLRMARAGITGLVAAGFFLWTSTLVHGEDLPNRNVRTCGEITLARPGMGVAYKASVQNSDYRFSAIIPNGLVGWGAAPNAPFHGFAVFLGSDQTSCIVFEIHLRVDLPEDRVGERTPRKRGRRVEVGNRRGAETFETGSATGSALQNVNVSLELHRNGYTNDASITLVTPQIEAAQNKRVFERFLASFHFE